MATIIVQENDEDILAILAVALETEGFNVKTVLGSDAAVWRLIKESDPKLVLLDLRLSGEEDIALCARIKALYPALPVIALSCNSKISERYRQYGFDGYLDKSFELETLYRLVNRYCFVLN